jgi:hypothetical protein
MDKKIKQDKFCGDHRGWKMFGGVSGLEHQDNYETTNFKRRIIVIPERHPRRDSGELFFI